MVTSRGRRVSVPIVGFLLAAGAVLTAFPFFWMLTTSLQPLIEAYNLFVFRQSMTTPPDELLEAARLDGAGELRILISIVLPLSKPILAVGGVLTFISGWNSFIWPLIIANDQNNYTLSVGISLLSKQLLINPPLQMAGASVMVIPIIVSYARFLH